MHANSSEKYFLSLDYIHDFIRPDVKKYAKKINSSQNVYALL